MLGNCATDRLSTVNEPTKTKTIEITIATIGRLMKNFDMASPAHRFRGEWFRIDADPGAYFLNSFGDNQLPWIQSTCNHPPPIHLWSDGDSPDVYFIVGINDRHLIAALELRDGALRNKQRTLFGTDDGTNSGVTTGS